MHRLSLKRPLRGGDDRGAALVAVIGAVSVVAVVSTTVLTSSVSAMQVTSVARASVQSEASAEAGIADAELGLRTANSCSAHGGVYTSTTTPVYSARVNYYDPSGWHAGCPDGHAATSVKVLSTGTAKDGVGTAGDTTVLEAVYAYTPASGSISGTGPAIFAGAVDTLNSVTVTDTATETGKTADVIITQGDYSLSCQSGTVITGSIIVTNGDLKLNGCIVLGGIQVRGFVYLNSSTVNGNVLAAGLTARTTDQGAVGYVFNSVVKGGLSVAGKVYLQSSTLGSVLGKTVSSIVNTVAPDVVIKGTLNLGGSISSWGVCGLVGQVTMLVCMLTNGLLGSATGSSLGNTGLPAVTPPTMPTMQKYYYSASDWAALGYTQVMWQGSCNVDSYLPDQAFLATVMASTTPVVVNAMACTKLNFSLSAALALTLKTNIAFVSQSFALEGVKINSSVSAGVNAWFIVPASVSVAATLADTCSGSGASGQIAINNNTVIGANVNVLAYTPGCISQDRTTWRGQEYSGTMHNGSSISVDYQTVGLPGTSLDGTVVASVTSAVLGSRTSLRQLS